MIWILCSDLAAGQTLRQNCSHDRGSSISCGGLGHQNTNNKKTTKKKHRKWRLKVFSLFVRTTLLRPSLQALRQQAAGRDWLFEPLLLYKSADCARELQSRRDGAVDTVRSSGGRGGGGNTRKKSEQHQQQSESKENQRRLNGCRIIDRKKSSR